MRSLAIFVGLLAGLTLSASSTLHVPSAEAKGIRQVQYTVKEGDTIYDLARRFGCTEKDLERANQLGAVLSVGEKLRIPDCKQLAKSEAKNEAKAAAKLASKPAEKAIAKGEEKPSGKRDERSTASRAVEVPQRAHGKVASKAAVRPRLPMARAKAQPRDAQVRENRDRRDRDERMQSNGAGDGASNGASNDASSVARDDAAADALAAAVADPAAPVVDPITGSVARARVRSAPPAREDVGLPRVRGVADPVTGSIATSASAALTGAITRPSDLDRARPLSEDLGELGAPLDTADQGGEEESDSPADHKLVIDGRAGGAVPRGGVLLDPAGTNTGSLAGPIAGQSIGLPWRGRLQSAARLGYGEGYVLRRPQRTYGTRTTVAHVEAALAELRHKFPRLHTLAVGDISAANGGRISEHRSHQSGRDIDLGLCFHERPRGYPEHFVVATEKTLNAAATFALISALADTAGQDGGLSMIFLDFNVQGMIYRWALAEGIDQERLDRIFQYPHGRGSGMGVVRHAPNHADHLHARFHCAEGETGCRQ